MTMGVQENSYLNQMSDLWWLPKNVATDKLLIGVGHHEVVADDEEVPPLDRWYRSFGHKGNLSNCIKYYPIQLVNDWRKACNNTNVYRTLKVFDKNTGEASLLGPFLIDIDNSDENLDDAQAIANQVTTYLLDEQKIPKDDMRIFFSGRKGFNVEIRPETLGIRGSVPDQIKLSSSKLDEIIAVLRNKNNIQDSYRDIVDGQGVVIGRANTTPRSLVSNHGTSIDQIYGDRFGYELKHPYIRLHNSTNKWIRDSGSEIARMKIELTVEQLCSMSAVGISSNAEELAQMPQIT